MSRLDLRSIRRVVEQKKSFGEDPNQNQSDKKTSNVLKGEVVDASIWVSQSGHLSAKKALMNQLLHRRTSVMVG